MSKIAIRLATILSLTSAVSLAISPVSAQTAATAAEATAAGVFVDKLADNVFALLKETASKSEIKAKFRSMLKKNFDVDGAGNRLIRRYRSQITPAQLAAYKDVLPDYIVNVYADRLINYSDADVKIVRTVPHGTSGAIDVFSRVSTSGKQPFDVIWAVQKGPTGNFLISNVTVSGVNLALTQEADFSSYIAKNGFDALVNMMKAANSRSA